MKRRLQPSGCDSRSAPYSQRRSGPGTATASEALLALPPPLARLNAAPPTALLPPPRPAPIGCAAAGAHPDWLRRCTRGGRYTASRLRMSRARAARGAGPGAGGEAAAGGGRQRQAAATACGGYSQALLLRLLQRKRR